MTKLKKADKHNKQTKFNESQTKQTRLDMFIIITLIDYDSILS